MVPALLSWGVGPQGFGLGQVLSKRVGQATLHSSDRLSDHQATLPHSPIHVYVEIHVYNMCLQYVNMYK